MKCLHCGKEIKDNGLSYCNNCYNELKKHGMFERESNKFCKICGRKLTDGDNIKKELCNKHYQQIRKYKFPLDDNQRNEFDLNEYTEYTKHYEGKLYDEFQEEIDDKFLIDKETYELIKDIRWDKSRNTIIGKINGKNIPLQNYILNTDEKINFVSSDVFDFRLNNMYVKRKKEKKRKVYNISKKNKNKIIIDFIGKSKTQVTGSSIIVSYPTGNNEYERLLIEFGQSQLNKSLYEEYKINKEVVDCVCNTDKLVACFILHSHL